MAIQGKSVSNKKNNNNKQTNKKQKNKKKKDKKEGRKEKGVVVFAMNSKSLTNPVILGEVPSLFAPQVSHL